MGTQHTIGTQQTAGNRVKGGSTQPTVDAFAELEQVARRHNDEGTSQKLLQGTRGRMVMGRDPRDAFFAMLALRLKMEPSWGVDTGAVDGTTMIYNPSWVSGLSHEEVRGFVAHEVMHCAFGHHARRGTRDKVQWNRACDLAINSILVESGFALPDHDHVPGVGKWNNLASGLSAEEYYSLLPQEPGDGDGDGESGAPGKGEGDGCPDPGGCGGVQDAGDNAQQEEAEADWKMAVAMATSACQGNLPAGLQRLVQQIVNPQADWTTLLRRFLESNARDDFSWVRPSRRHIAAGIYLPSVQSDQLGLIVVDVDTSGSIGQEIMDRFAAEIQGMAESYSCSLRIQYRDTKVQGTQEWSPSEGDLELLPVGGGGTNHRSLPQDIEDIDEPVKCVVCLTDGYTSFPEELDVPVFWVMTTHVEAPFGETVRI
jgi:predicted metal-dependent peptidase